MNPLTGEESSSLREYHEERRQKSRPKDVPQPKTKFSPEQIEEAPSTPFEVPTMHPGERQIKLDKLLDLYSAETDPAKKQQIEQQIRSLSASIKVHWWRRHAAARLSDRNVEDVVRSLLLQHKVMDKLAIVDGVQAGVPHYMRDEHVRFQAMRVVDLMVSAGVLTWSSDGYTILGRKGYVTPDTPVEPYSDEVNKWWGEKTAAGDSEVAEELITQTLIENTDRFPYEDLIKEVSRRMTKRFKNLDEETAAITVSNTIHKMFSTYRISREEGVVYFQSDLQMLADQIVSVMYYKKVPMTLGDIWAAMKEAYKNEDQDAIDKAVDYLRVDEGRIKITDDWSGYVVVEPGSEMSQSEQTDWVLKNFNKGLVTPPRPGSRPVEEVLEETPAVNQQEEENRLLDEYSEGQITQTEMEQKLRRLRASRAGEVHS